VFAGKDQPLQSNPRSGTDQISSAFVPPMLCREEWVITNASTWRCSGQRVIHSPVILETKLRRRFSLWYVRRCRTLLSYQPSWGPRGRDLGRVLVIRFSKIDPDGQLPDQHSKAKYLRRSMSTL
jgi:hypothetical protein